MLRLRDLAVPLDALLPQGADSVERAVRTRLSVPSSYELRITPLRRSIDARKRSDVHLVMTVALDVGAHEQKLLSSGIIGLEPYTPPVPHTAPHIADKPSLRPIVVGTGPAGLFAALELAQAGACPLVVERGQDVHRRRQTVDGFIATGRLDTSCNIQFGEGGAGTFSDGKLSTNIHNPLTRTVLEAFVEAGAPEDILIDAKPHVGTDLLSDIIATLRERIIALGGEVLFDTCLVDIEAGAARTPAPDSTDGPVLTGAILQGPRGERRRVACEALVLACGHSARDTYRMLRTHEVAMHPKAFSMGVRIEHLQADIDKARWGRFAGDPLLPAADYHLSAKCADGRGVYSFCMCPGGEVVCAASEEGGVVTNGMSRHARDGVNANSALLASVSPADYGASEDGDPLIGLDFQRRYEKAAFEMGLAGDGPTSKQAYRAPAQLLGDLVAGRATTSDAGKHGKVQPSYARGVTWCDLAGCLPAFVVDALREAVPLLDRRLHGFADPAAVLTGVETRSSSPVSIDRDATGQASIRGLYPCGEGAGHAGGIMSAAVDGIRMADDVCLRYTSL